jgi:addiction module HigA family antidote
MTAHVDPTILPIRPASHPGEHLRDALTAREITPYRLALACRVKPSRIDDVLKGRRAITADTALRLARALGTSPDFWMGLQADYDLFTARAALAAVPGDELALCTELPAPAPSAG